MLTWITIGHRRSSYSLVSKSKEQANDHDPRPGGAAEQPATACGQHPLTTGLPPWVYLVRWVRAARQGRRATLADEVQEVLVPAQVGGELRVEGCA